MLSCVLWENYDTGRSWKEHGKPSGRKPAFSTLRVSTVFEVPRGMFFAESFRQYALHVTNFVAVLVATNRPLEIPQYERVCRKHIVENLRSAR
jgi:hypothetical protein